MDKIIFLLGILFFCSCYTTGENSKIYKEKTLKTFERELDGTTYFVNRQYLNYFDSCQLSTTKSTFRHKRLGSHREVTKSNISEIINILPTPEYIPKLRTFVGDNSLYAKFNIGIDPSGNVVFSKLIECEPKYYKNNEYEFNNAIMKYQFEQEENSYCFDTTSIIINYNN